MDLGPVKRAPADKLYRVFFAGIDYLREKKIIAFQIVLVGVVSFFGFSCRSIAPSIVGDVFRTGPKVLGYFYSTLALGSFVGSMFISAHSKQMTFNSPTFKMFVIGGSLVNALAMLSFSFLSGKHIFPALILFFVMGLGYVGAVIPLRGMIQTHIAEEIRGRIMGFVFTFFSGGLAIGSACIGLLAGRYGIMNAIRLTGILALVVAIGLFSIRRRIASTEK
jgi:MFS family permease